MSQRAFSEITLDTWSRLKAYGRDRHGTSYQPDGAAIGTATTRTPMGTVVLEFAFEADDQRLTYTIKEKPFLIVEAAIWSGIERAIADCR